MPSQAKNLLVAQIFRMPDFVEPAAVTTAGHYILASHLLRSLTKLDKFGKIQGDIAVRWSSSPDRKTWTLHLGEAKFSNGEAITAQDVIASIEREQRLGAGVHFPFAEIVGLRAKGPREVEVQLRNARNDFIFDLSKPEFGVLSREDVKKGRDEPIYAVTSGPYFLLSRQGNAYHLRRNSYFHEDSRNDLDLVITSTDTEQSPRDLTSGKISFLSTQQNLPAEVHRRIAESPGIQAIRPHVAFSYWLSLNPESPYFKNAKHRANFQAYVRGFHAPDVEAHSWEKADQLYLPDGDGRPSPADLDATWKKIEMAAGKPGGKPKLRVVPLKTSNPLFDKLLDYLRVRYDVEMVPYETEEELISLLRGNHFELKISCNDFSSVDLSENLKVTFNGTRPYIFVGKNQTIPKLLREATQTEDKALQASLFQKIGLAVLSEGLIAPVGYQRIWFYLNRKIDISTWSSIAPEISFWKASVHD